MAMGQKIRFGIKRFIRMVLLLICISMFTFGIVVNSPIDALQEHLGSAALVMSEEQARQVMAELDLDKTPVERYEKWAGNIVRGDWGYSTIYNQPVSEMIAERFQGTFFLMIFAWILSGIIGLTLGVVSAVKEGHWIDRAIRIYCMTLASSPKFWLGLLFLMLFAGYLGWFPIGLTGGLGKIAEDVSFGERIYHMILPAITLSFVSVADITLHTRAKAVEVLRSDYVLYARANRKSEKEIIKGHVLRNILLPAVTLQFLSFSELFGGAVFIEQIFSYPGLAGLVQEAAMKGDVALLLGIVLISAIWVFTGNLIADILYLIIDPRIKEA